MQTDELGLRSRLMESATIRESMTNAIRFWEPWRLVYNLVLAAVVVGYFVAGYPATKGQLSVDAALGLFVLAVIANVAYCAAYPVDVFVQASGFREAWQRGRWVLFAIGTIFAAVLARFVAMTMFHAR